MDQPHIPPDARRRAADWLSRRVPGALALIAHGAGARGQSVPGAPCEVLLVVTHPIPADHLGRWHSTLSRRLRQPRLRLEALESYRLGWLPPSLLQQSLRATGVVLWGDPSILRLVPDWPPERLDPRLALDEQQAAEADLAAGWEALAVQRAAGALLIARRAYAPGLAARAALRRVWPEAPAMQVAAAEFVPRARELIVDWLFTWEGSGPDAAAVQRYLALRAAAGPLRALL